MTRSPQFNQDTTITILEASGIASGASGKAGGLLALDWHGVATASLAELSYQLHKELAAEHEGRRKWGYRELTTMEVELDATKNGPVKRVKELPEWIDEKKVNKIKVLGTTDTTAQVHPERFTQTICALAQEKGVQVRLGSATKINVHEATNQVKSVSFFAQDHPDHIEEIPADIVVATAGPWTTNILPFIPMASRRAHSITIKTPQPLSAHAIFTNLRSSDGKTSEPEIYIRSDEIYICGEGDDLIKLPDLARDVQVVQDRCDLLKKQIDEISPQLKEGIIDRKQACYLPINEMGEGPLIGWVNEQKMKGVAICAGHSVWGITLGPGSGKVMSELIMDGKIHSANVKRLKP